MKDKFHIDTQMMNSESRAAIRERRRRRRRRQQLLQYLACVVMIILLVIIVVVIVEEIQSHKMPEVVVTEEPDLVISETTAEPEPEAVVQVGVGWNYPDEDGWYTVGDVKILAGYTAEATENTAYLDEGMYNSEYIVLIDETTNTISAQRNADVVISPASMTKILTILVAAEHISDLDEPVTITREMTDYSYINGCSAVGFYDGEQVPVCDLFYGTILPSGADAAYALAVYTAGSQEAFVELMNEKVAELGLSDTAHFSNCVGIYDEENHCTVTDMAMILKAAVENDWCREVLSTRRYTTTQTEQNEEGIFITNSFLLNAANQESGGEILCAKTGYVDESRYCAASYYVSDSGKPYICVTATAPKKELTIEDHANLYNTYAE